MKIHRLALSLAIVVTAFSETVGGTALLIGACVPLVSFQAIILLSAFITT